MFRQVFHPTDFSTVSQVAFAHALRTALAAKGTLTVLHVAPEGSKGGVDSGFPHIRRTLAAWKLVSPSCRPEEVAALGVIVKKLGIESDDPSEAIAGYLSGRQMDLLVLATHQRAGLGALAHPPVAQPVMRATQRPSLFIPPRSDGFIRYGDGVSSLRRILVPVTADPEPQAAVDAAVSLGQLLATDEVELTLLHVGDERDMPKVHEPRVPGWRCDRVAVGGSVVSSVLAPAQAGHTDLIVMRTRGPKGFLGALRGSTASQIIRAAPCPVLAIPCG